MWASKKEQINWYIFTRVSNVSVVASLSSFISISEIPHFGFLMIKNCALCRSSFTSRFVWKWKLSTYSSYFVKCNQSQLTQPTTFSLVNIFTISASVKYEFSFEFSHILDIAFLVRMGCKRFNNCNTDSMFSFIIQFTPGALRSGAPSRKHCGMLLSINTVWNYKLRSIYMKKKKNWNKLQIWSSFKPVSNWHFFKQP